MTDSSSTARASDRDAAAAMSRKRKASMDDESLLQGGEEDCSNTTTTPEEDSVEDALAVPFSIIFRQVPASQKPLLSRAEAKCFLQITMLAQEIDTLTALAKDAFHRRLWCQKFAQKILPSSSETIDANNKRKSNPFLRSLLPILTIQGNMITTSALHGMDHELSRILAELDHCALSLKQFSESNWTVSESLLETLGEDYLDDSNNSNHENMEEKDLPKGIILAREKRRLSDLQEEVSHRIESLLAKSDGNNQDEEDEVMEEEQEPSQESRVGGNDQDKTLFQVCAELWNLPSLSQKKPATTQSHSTTTSNNNNKSSNNINNGASSFAQQQVAPPKKNHQRMIQHDDDYEEEEDAQREGVFSYPETFQGLDQKMEDAASEQGQTDMAVDALQALQQQQQQRKRNNTTDESQQSTHSVVSNHSSATEYNNDNKNEIPTFVSAPSTTSTRTTTPVNRNNYNTTESQVQRQDASEALAALAGFG